MQRAGALAAASVWAKRRPKRLLPWGLTGFLAVSLATSGAWITHAVARSDDRPFLMSFTALHQFGAAVWLGSVLQLGIFWQLIRRHPELKGLWPGLLRGFAWVSGPAMLCVVATGLLLARNYIGTWQGLIGTDYGAMVLIKVGLLGAVLGFAALNFSAARRRHAGASTGDVFQRVPHYVEAEILLLIAILFAAVSLSSQPPAIDLNDPPATWAELYEVFRPKVPRYRLPPMPKWLLPSPAVRPAARALQRA